MNIDREQQIRKYRAQKKAMTASGEAWRIRYQVEEDFIEQLDALISDYRNDLYINAFHRESTLTLGLEILHQRNISQEEMVAQANMLQAAKRESFMKYAPAIKEYVSRLKSPLSQNDQSNIYRWISRDQIALDDLPTEVKAECLQSERIMKLVNNKEA